MVKIKQIKLNSSFTRPITCFDGRGTNYDPIRLQINKWVDVLVSLFYGISTYVTKGLNSAFFYFYTGCHIKVKEFTYL